MTNYNSFTKTFPLTVIFTAIVTVTLIIFKQSEVGISFLLGSVTSLWAMSMLYKSSAKIVKQDEKEAKKKAIINYALRFAVYAIVLVVAYIRPNFNFYAVAAGLFSFKLMLYLSIFLDRKGEVNE